MHITVTPVDDIDCLVFPTGIKQFVWTVLHLHIGSSMAYVEASLPVGADTQTFRPSTNAWFAMDFKRNNLPMV